jgi:ribose transport system substrate-binding protein
MNSSRTLGGLILLTIALTSAACSKDTGATSGPGKEQIKVGFVSNNAYQFWTYAEAGTTVAAKKYDVEVVFRRPQSGTAAEQKKIIEDLLAQDVKAIAISVNDPKNQRDFLNEVADKVPLITQDNDAPDSKRRYYVGTNNYAAGESAGKLVLEAMPEGGTIAIFVGLPEAINGQERRQGLLDVLVGQKNAQGDKFGKYTLVNPPAYYDYVDTRKCKDLAADALTALQNVEHLCFIGLWEYNPPCLLQAVQQAGRVGKVKMVAFDENEVTLQGVKSGSIYGTVVQQPYLFGVESVKVMAALVRNDHQILDTLPKDGKVYVPHRVIKKDDVDAFQKGLRAMLGK